MGYKKERKMNNITTGNFFNIPWFFRVIWKQFKVAELPQIVKYASILIHHWKREGRWGRKEIDFINPRRKILDATNNNQFAPQMTSSNSASPATTNAKGAYALQQSITQKGPIMHQSFFKQWSRAITWTVFRCLWIACVSKGMWLANSLER